MTYKRGVSKGRPDISILVELTVLSKLCKKEEEEKNVNFRLAGVKLKRLRSQIKFRQKKNKA